MPNIESRLRCCEDALKCASAKTCTEGTRLAGFAVAFSLKAPWMYTSKFAHAYKNLYRMSCMLSNGVH